MRNENLDSLGKLTLRLLVGGLMLFHGIHKIMNGAADVRADLAAHGLPEAMAYGAFVSELLAPLCIVFGVATRAAALVYSGGILFAVLLVHAGDFARLAPSGGWAAELYVFYAVGGLAVALLGSGRYAVMRGEGRFD